MTTDLDPLWRAVYDSPDDDAPRLALASALSALGDPRGEFIALQLASADDARAAALLREHRDAWLGPLKPHLRWRRTAVFRRGFPVEATVRVKDRDVASVAALAEWATFERIDFFDHPVSFVAPHMRALRDVGPLSPDAARSLASAASPWKVERVTLGQFPGTRLPRDAFAALAESDALPALRHVKINVGHGAPHEFAWLWRAPFAPALESLAFLGALPLRVVHAIYRAAKTHAPRLRELTLTVHPLWLHFASGDGDDERLAHLSVNYVGYLDLVSLFRTLLALPADGPRTLAVRYLPDRSRSPPKNLSPRTLAAVALAARRFTALRALDLSQVGGDAIDLSRHRAPPPDWAKNGGPLPLARFVGGWLTTAAFDGDALVVAAGPQLFRLAARDPASVVPEWRGHRWIDLCATQGINKILLSDAHCIVAEFGYLTRFDLSGRAEERVTHSPLPHYVDNVATSHDGALLVGWNRRGKTLTFFKADTLEFVATLAAPARVVGAAFAHDGASVFVSCEGKPIRRLCLDAGRLARGVPVRSPTSMALATSRDGRWLVAWSGYEGVYLWNLADGASEVLAPKINGGSYSHAAAFAEQRGWLFYSRPDGVFVRDLSTGAPARRLDLGPDAHLIASSSNGEFIALSLGTRGTHGLYVYDVAQGALCGSVTTGALPGE